VEANLQRALDLHRQGRLDDAESLYRAVLASAPANFDALHLLWILETNDAAPRCLKHEAEARGIAAERLIFARHVTLEDHLSRQRLADLFLDTLPYNAHTTASDALWAGLPVLTCAGSAFAGRVAASLLSGIGLPELVTHNLADYKALALHLARDKAALAAIKASLSANRSTMPLFDTDRFRRHLEAAFMTIWECHNRGEPPDSFAVTPIGSTAYR
jgi:predicted O-linked N-acetylglucosamine transferase (SPINDLY family)